MAQAGHFYLLVMTCDKQRAEVLAHVHAVDDTTARFFIVHVISGSLPADQLTMEHTCHTGALVNRIIPQK